MSKREIKLENSSHIYKLGTTTYLLGPELSSLQNVFERLPTSGGGGGGAGVAVLARGLLVILEDLLLLSVMLDVRVTEGVGLVPLPVASPAVRPDSRRGDRADLRPMAAPLVLAMLPFLTSICLRDSGLSTLGVLGVREPLSECS